MKIIVNKIEVSLVAKDGKVFATSLDVAKVFEKQHAHVMRDIRAMSTRALSNFGESSYLNEQGREMPMYEMNRDGFSFLVMGFTGEKADNFKLDFIDGFNQIEEALRLKPQFQIPQTLSQALFLASQQAEQIEQQSKILLEQKPKVEFYEAITGSKDTVDIGTVAKVLNIRGFGRNNLFEFLRDNGVLMSNNLPKQTYCDRGYFRVIESKFNKPDGSTHINTKTVVYQKGMEYIRKILRSEASA